MDYVKNIDLSCCLSLLLVVCTQSVEEFTAPVAGEYKLECWGASVVDAKNCGGGYSYGEYNLDRNNILYICVGGEGTRKDSGQGGLGGYNGGGNGGTACTSKIAGGTGGGGATHIALQSGLLTTFKDNYDLKLLLVAGGAGGGGYYYCIYGFGGGLQGGSSYLWSKNLLGKQATQTSGYAFGQGQNGKTKTSFDTEGAEGGGGGGGGFWGGFSPQSTGSHSNWVGGGGSGFINKRLLKNAQTISGDQQFISPSGSLEIGHSGDGACIVTQLSFK